ncbi:50S ribosomal protein L33 [Bacillus andreraoultii]|nr:50S ribosomal protein L33 [Bacillus andreraoultii]
MPKKIVLACSVCGCRNYKTTESNDSKQVRLELKKYCPNCQMHTVHRQA